eukprot:6175204-Pleurochrysis_carterae.AAC.1
MEDGLTGTKEKVESGKQDLSRRMHIHHRPAVSRYSRLPKLVRARKGEVRAFVCVRACVRACVRVRACVCGPRACVYGHRPHPREDFV